MLKFGLFAFIGIVSLVGSTTADKNDTFLETAEELILHFPRYLEEALNLDEENQGTNSTDRSLFGRSQCARDFLHIFTGLRKKNHWAVRGTHTFDYIY